MENLQKRIWIQILLVSLENGIRWYQICFRVFHQTGQGFAIDVVAIDVIDFIRDSYAPKSQRALGQ